MRIRLDDFVLAASRWSRSSTRVGDTVVLSRVMDAATVRQIAQEHPDAAVRRALSGPRRARAPARISRRIRVEPAATAAVAGVVPPDGVPDELGERQGAWRLVNDLGTVGWIEV